MHILYLTSHRSRACGRVRVSADMACTQIKQNNIVAYACSGGDCVEHFQKSGAQVFFPAKPHRSFKQFFSALSKFNRITKNFRPDVVHIYMAAQNVLIQPFQLLRLEAVATIHNEFDRSVRLIGPASRIASVSKCGAQALHRRWFLLSKIRVVANGPINSPRLPPAFEPASFSIRLW